MKQPTKSNLEEEIKELTCGAITNEYIDPWIGKLRRVAMGMKRAQNK